ncbi:MAG: cupin domain-containing protein [Paracoccaceae bacterium]
MRSIVTSAVLAATAAFALTPSAQAAGCPQEHVLSEPRQVKGVGQERLTREVIANVRLEGWRDMGGFILRTRRLELQPGGTVPTHSHADRPAIVYVMKGTVIEHNSFCAVPIEHHAGDVSEEFAPGFVHWWENRSNEVVTFLSSDVVPYPSDAELFYGFEANSSPDDARE